MREDIARAWIADLRTNPPQYIGSLSNEDGSAHCCLGRLCVVIGINIDTNYQQPAYNAIRDQTGLLRPSSDHCFAMNDSKGMSFAEIADYIEQNWEMM